MKAQRLNATGQRHTALVPTPFDPLLTSLLDRLAQSHGTKDADTRRLDFRTFLAALQDIAPENESPAKKPGQDATAPIQANAPPHIQSLDNETRAALSTAEAAYHLNRAQQTLRLWASQGCGPIRPFRVHGRLAWPVSELRRVLGVA